VRRDNDYAGHHLGQLERRPDRSDAVLQVRRAPFYGVEASSPEIA
jgi:hypothetical protein